MGRCTVRVGTRAHNRDELTQAGRGEEMEKLVEVVITFRQSTQLTQNCGQCSRRQARSRRRSSKDRMSRRPSAISNT